MPRRQPSRRDVASGAASRAEPRSPHERTPPAQDYVLALQRTAGNAAVATALLQRQVKAPPKHQPPMPTADGLKAIADNARRRHAQCEEIVVRYGPDAVTSATFMLKDAVQRYARVHSSIASTLADSRLPTPKEDNSALIGLAVGTALGALASLVGGPKAGIIVFSVAKSAAEELLELGAMKAITSGPAPTVLALDPSGLSPLALSLDAWDEIGRLHQRILTVAGVAFGLGKAMAGAAHIRGEVRVMAAGGKPEIPVAEIRQIGAALTRFDQQTAHLDQTLPAAKAWLERVRTYDPRPETTSVPRRRLHDHELFMLMYHDMWMLWIADQYDDTLAQALTRKPLRTALRQAGIVEDENRKVDAPALLESARGHRRALRNRIDQMARLPG
jgi:hypothetical protein